MNANVFEEVGDDNIFKDQRVLNPDRTPTRDEFVKREEELNKLVSILRHVDRGGARNFTITGPSGSGKTMAVKITLRDLEDHVNGDLQTVYMTDLNNELRVLRRLSDQLDLDYKGTDLNHYYDRIADTVLNNELHLVIVLDELEKILVQKGGGKNHGNAFLKQLLEVRKRVVDADKNASLTVIGISNYAYIDESMSPKVKSRFGRENIHFSKYNALELREILERRKGRAFQSGAIEEGVISKAAARVGNNSGDAREAIEMLKVAGDIALDEGAGRIQQDHIDKAHRQIEADRTVDAIRSVSKQSQFLALATITAYENEEVNFPATTGEIYKKYRELTEKVDHHTVTQRRVRDLLSELDMLGVFRVNVVSKGAHGRKSKIWVDLSDETIADLKEYLESELLV